MLKPSKHEDLRESTIMLGSVIIKRLKKKESNLDELLQLLKYKVSEEITLNQFYETLTFLWFLDIIEVNNADVKLLK